MAPRSGRRGSAWSREAEGLADEALSHGREPPWDALAGPHDRFMLTATLGCSPTSRQGGREAGQTLDLGGTENGKRTDFLVRSLSIESQKKAAPMRRTTFLTKILFLTFFKF
jgi:hypothetical protein